MEPMPGAIEAVRCLIDMGFDVWAATKPPTGIAPAYSDKAAWIFKYLPELTPRVIITHDKGLLGDNGDFLIDDRPHKANCDRFPGTLIVFREGNRWPEILDRFKRPSLTWKDGIHRSAPER
jgi:5'(3')-deoxyribonucleotidase